MSVSGDSKRPSSRQGRSLPHSEAGGDTPRPNHETRSSARVTKTPAKISREFGRYRIIRRLGKGGMGTVFLAEDTQLQREVALKIPQFESDDDHELLERFYREARAAATLNHPNLCPVFDVGEIDGIHYLTMAFIEGEALSEMVRPGEPLSAEQASVIVHKVALGMAEAHEKGIVHRDLKPANISMNQRGDPVVMDFGLARHNNSGDARLTKSGAVIGTPAYMAPEQIEGDIDAIGPGCDIYSLGVILFELLTGEIPFDGPIAAVLGQVLTQEPPPPSRFRSDLDMRLETICLKMMAKQREDRYASMFEVADALGEFLFETTRAGAYASTSGTSAANVQTDANETVGGGTKSRRTIFSSERFTAVSQFVRRSVETVGQWSAPRKKSLGIAIAGAVLFLVVCMSAIQFFGDADGTPSQITDGIGTRLVLIPAGEFSMGDSASHSGFDDERPRHRVTITKPFYMGAYEVTQKEYVAVMGENPSEFEGDNRPVEKVAWNDAREFCRKLGVQENVVYRLPTEAEWEYACRAGSSMPWHFGDDANMLSEYAWSADTKRGTTNEVGQLKANGFGLFDIHGNVLEWCSDWYSAKYYSESAASDPQGPSEGDANREGITTKVARGGSWDSSAATCRSAYRGTNGIKANSPQTGFRVVRVVEN
ncbi:MAG: SUMF1/EgtB/PvdO family nonheme iron enzyme [Planctomycetaceae bacterium]|nr:SUMF1/EgtB/PvdO family nonheme iron enzyme [Planctomycetaceae bacterium]